MVISCWMYQCPTFQKTTKWVDWRGRAEERWVRRRAREMRRWEERKLISCFIFLTSRPGYWIFRFNLLSVSVSGNQLALGNWKLTKFGKYVSFPGWGVPARQFRGGGGSSGRREEEKVDQEAAKDSRSGSWSADQVARWLGCQVVRLSGQTRCSGRCWADKVIRYSRGQVIRSMRRSTEIHAQVDDQVVG